jgi:hypothetical protein
MTRKRKPGAGDDHAGTVIPSHRIERNPDLICHWTTVRSRLRLSGNSQAAVTCFHANFRLKVTAAIPWL